MDSVRWLVVCGVFGCGGASADGGDDEAAAESGASSDSAEVSDGATADDAPSTNADASSDATTSDTPDGSGESTDPSSSSTGVDPCDPPDGDGDGHAAIACGGLDCDDRDPLVHPDAIDYGPVAETVVPDSVSGAMTTTVGVDADGVVYVAHEYATQARLADNATGAWIDQQVGDGQGFDVHIDPDGNRRVASVINMGSNTLVYSPAPGMIEYPPFDSPSTGNVAQGRFMAVDGLGRTHLVWSPVIEDGVRWAMRDDDGEWISELVDDQAALGAVIEVTDDGQPWVLYDSVEPRVATRVDGVWEHEALDVQGVAYAAVDVDSAGHIHAALGVHSQTITYLTNASGAWVQEEIGDFGSTFYMDLAIGPDDAVYIVAEDHSRMWVAVLDLLTNASGQWRQETLRSEANVMLPGIAFSGDELLVGHVVLYEEVALVRARLPNGVDDDCDGDVW
jgi:hypothetical protein